MHQVKGSELAAQIKSTDIFFSFQQLPKKLWSTKPPLYPHQWDFDCDKSSAKPHTTISRSLKSTATLGDRWCGIHESSPVQHTTQDATELLSPLHYLNADDVQFLGPVLHSTPDTREHSITTSLHERQWHWISEYDARTPNNYDNSNINGNEDLVEPEDSVLHIGPQSEDGDGELPTSHLCTEDHSEENVAEPTELSMVINDLLFLE